MQYRSLGRSALKVSALCLGTMNFGPRTTRSESFDILNHATDAGINFIDTANQYGGVMGVGTSEEIIGEWSKQNPARRDRIVLATKVYEPMSEDVNDRGLSARHIQMACEASLKRLGTDHIDLYQMHHLDRAAPIEEIWQAMDRLIAQGKITYVGSSNFPGWAIARANETAKSTGRLGLISEQSLYNLFERRIELEVLPACREYGLGLIPWSPLAGGLLAGKSSAEKGRRSSAEMRESAAQLSAQLADFAALCEQIGEPQSRVALAWVLHQAGVSAVAIGPGSVQQLQATLPVADITLSAGTLEALDQIFPPCGAAPEAYAW